VGHAGVSWKASNPWILGGFRATLKLERRPLLQSDGSDLDDNLVIMSILQPRLRWQAIAPLLPSVEVWISDYSDVRKGRQ
jgi:hypothetical protein